MFGKKLFGGHISPACEYCRYGEPSADNQKGHSGALFCLPQVFLRPAETGA